MEDLVHEAAEAVVPLLSAGVGAATSDMASRAGRKLSETTIAVLGKLRGRLGSGPADRRSIRAHIAAALANGEISESDLRALLRDSGPVNQSQTVVQGDVKNLFQNPRIEIKHGDFIA